MQTTFPWAEVFFTSLQDLWFSFLGNSLTIVGALLLFIFGWIFASLLKSAVKEIFDYTKIDKALQKAGVDEALNQAGFSLDVGSFVGSLLKWFIVILFLRLSMGLLNITALDGFFEQIVNYVPSLLIGIAILMATSIIARFGRILVEGSSKGLEIKDSKTLGHVIAVSIWVFGISAAAANLGIKEGLIQWFLIGVIAMGAIAGGLAFGIGGQGVAKRILEKYEDNTK